jgi:hypothetical protein
MKKIKKVLAKRKEENILVASWMDGDRAMFYNNESLLDKEVAAHFNSEN